MSIPEDLYDRYAQQSPLYDKLITVETIMIAVMDAVRSIESLGEDDADDIETLKAIHNRFDRYRDSILEQLHDDVLEAVNG